MSHASLNSQDEWTPSEKTLLQPYLYLLDHPGKEIRSKLIDAFDYYLNVPTEALVIIVKVIEMLHTASLLIDDVEDDSVLRRGVPVAHLIYGVPLTINCANYVYFLALQKVQTLGNDKVVKIFTDELIQLHKGQGMEIHWRENSICPSLDDYLEMVGNKTGGLLRLAVKLMQLFSSSNIELSKLVNLLGIHFQIRDDYINLKSGEYIDSRGYAEDLTEGKYSFLIIHCIQNHDPNKLLSNILSQKTKDNTLKLHAIQQMEKAGSFLYTREYLKNIELEAIKEIGIIGSNPQLLKIIQFLSKAYTE